MQKYADRQRALGLKRCDDWAGQVVVALEPESLLDVGCGDGDFLLHYLKKRPREFSGIEGMASRQEKARKHGIKVVGCDLNGRWPFEDGKFDVVFSSQVIEHLHNTRLFVEEAYRVLKPGGTAIIASENLCSLLNCVALCLGYTPFSLMQLCGRYLGNPLGLHYQEPHPEAVSIEDAAFSGITGHVRVLTVRQAQELFTLTGFDAEVRSVGILPLPDFISRALERFVRNRGHFLIIRATKPQEHSRSS
ncbi:MAG: class I SAM-dependent methyltransferase [Verrucomicrobiota bacterium]